MIGARAFLLDMAFPLLWLLISLAILAVVLRSRKSKVETTQVSTSNMKTRGAIAVIVVALCFANGIFRLSRQLQNRSALHDISVDSVSSIRVGNVQLERSSEVSAVLAALRDSQWYVPTARDGGWANTVDLVIRLRAGEQRRYRIGRFLRHEGAVVDFIGQDPRSPFVAHYGYAFVKQLPDVLERIGAALPSERH